MVLKKGWNKVNELYHCNTILPHLKEENGLKKILFF